MYKHLLYSIKGKKILYILFLLTVVIATIVSLYTVNLTIELAEKPYYDRIFFEEPSPKYSELDKLVANGDIIGYEEAYFISVDQSTLHFKTEPTNKFFGKNYVSDGIILDEYFMRYRLNVNIGDKVNIGGKTYKVLAITQVFGGAQGYLPFDKDNINELGYTRHYVQVEVDGRITNKQLNDLSNAGLTSKNLGGRISFHEVYSRIFPFSVISIISLACVYMLHLYILKSDKDTNRILVTVGANNIKFLATLILEFLAIFSIGYSIGYGLFSLMFNLLNSGGRVYATSAVIGIVWLIIAMSCSIIIGITNRKNYAISIKKASKVDKGGKV